MMPESLLSFGLFRLDPVNEKLWQGEREIPLGAKALALLKYLVQNPGRLVSKDELLKQVWAGTYVTQTVLKVHIHAIREMLGDDVDAPRHIETVPRLGYRFIAALTSTSSPHPSLESGV